MKRFKWEVWDYDLEGRAYVVAKSECKEACDVPSYIIERDGLSPACAADMVVEEGWCKYQVRSDWYDMDGPGGGYVVEKIPHSATTFKGRRGWFPVWIVRAGKW